MRYMPQEDDWGDREQKYADRFMWRSLCQLPYSLVRCRFRPIEAVSAILRRWVKTILSPEVFETPCSQLGPLPFHHQQY